MVVAVHAAVVAPTPVLAGALAVEFGVKRLLLLGAQGGVEGFHGFIALVGLGGVPGAQFAHAVNALGGGELVQFLEVRAGGALARLHRGGELGPGAFLGSGQLEFFFQGGLALGHAFLVALRHVTGLAGGGAGGLCGSGCRSLGLGQGGQSECGQHGGGYPAAA